LVIVWLLVLMVAVMIGAPDRPSSASFFFQVIHHTMLGLIGPLIALLIVGISVATLCQPRGTTVFVNAEQVNDLERLMDKVEEIRARNILRRVEREDTGS
jgi:hypothetical protein